ncbi:MAG: polysaccharide biosynthesis tyrosine autokinase [Pseudomonadota bacterium]
MTENYRRFPLSRRTEMHGVVPIHDLNQVDTLQAAEMGYYDEPDGDRFDIRAALTVLLSRKWMILAITLVGVMISFALTLRVAPMYASSATIEIQQQEFQIIEGAGVGPELIADNAYMETQQRLITSLSLAERVAEDLNLANDPRYASSDLPRETRIKQAASRVSGGIRVSPIGRSRLVAISFVSPFRAEAARIANGVAEAYIQTNLERKYNTTAFAREFLDERLLTTKLALEDAERRFTQYAAEKGLLDIGGATSGAGSLEEDAIVSLNGELSVAESERIRAEQEYLIASEQKQSIEFLQSTSLSALRQTRSTLLSDYQEMRNRFKPDYPDMVTLQARIDRVEKEIVREADTIVLANINELKLNFEAAVAREESLRTRVQELRNTLQDERSRRIEYRILEREVETIRSQYEALLQRSKEVSIASGVGSSNISIVDLALVPSSPFQPNLRRSLLQALVLSLAFGMALAFVLNYLDDTIKSPEDVRSKLNLPCIGVIPKAPKKTDLVKQVTDQPKSQYSEAFATAQAALEFSTSEGLPRSMLITSTRPGEGKTSTTASLAMSFARSGKNTLIIDADMRKPSFVVDSSDCIGLSGLLTGREHLKDHVIASSTPQLSVLTAGPLPPDPAQLLAGYRLREIIKAAEDVYDVVLIDSPPILNFADGPRLGSVVAGALIVLEAGLIRRPAALRTLTQMYDSRVNVLGCVLTKFNPKASGYDYGYYYSAYGTGANSYVSTDVKSDGKRRVLISAAQDDDNSDEIERWA